VLTQFVDKTVGDVFLRPVSRPVSTVGLHRGISKVGWFVFSRLLRSIDGSAFSVFVAVRTRW